MAGIRIVSHSQSPLHYAQVMASVHTPVLTGNPFSLIGETLSSTALGVEADVSQIQAFDVSLSQSLNASSVPSLLADPASVDIIRHNIGLAVANLTQTADPNELLADLETLLFVGPDNQGQPSAIKLQFTSPKNGDRPTLILSNDLGQPKIRAIRAFERLARIKRDAPKAPPADDLGRIDELKRLGIFRNQVVRFGIHLSDGPPRYFALMPGQSITVGRNGNDVQINNMLDNVSNQHLKITNIDGVLFVQDLDSTNGTFVDDAQIKSKHLTETTTFNLANQERMRIEIIPVLTDPQAEIAKGNTRLITAITVIDMSGEHVPITHTEDFPPGFSLTFGRNGDVDIKLDERNISRSHCILSNSDGFLYLSDSGSAYGTFNESKQKITGPTLIDETKPNYFYIGDFRLEVFVLRREQHLPIDQDDADSALADVLRTAQESDEGHSSQAQAAQDSEVDDDGIEVAEAPDTEDAAVEDEAPAADSHELPDSFLSGHASPSAAAETDDEADWLYDFSEVDGDDGIEVAPAPDQADTPDTADAAQLKAALEPEVDEGHDGDSHELPDSFLADQGDTEPSARGPSEVEQALADIGVRTRPVASPASEPDIAPTAGPAAIPELASTPTSALDEDEALAAIEASNRAGGGAPRDQEEPDEDLAAATLEEVDLDDEGWQDLPQALLEIDDRRQAYMALHTALMKFNHDNVPEYESSPPLLPSDAFLDTTVASDIEEDLSGGDKVVPTGDSDEIEVVSELYEADAVQAAIEAARREDLKHIMSQLELARAFIFSDYKDLPTHDAGNLAYTHEDAIDCMDVAREVYIALLNTLSEFNRLHSLLDPDNIAPSAAPSSAYLESTPQHVGYEVTSAINNARSNDLDMIRAEFRLANLFILSNLQSFRIAELQAANEELSNVNAGLESTVEEHGAEIGRIQQRSPDEGRLAELSSTNRELRGTVKDLERQLHELQEAYGPLQEEVEKLRAQNARILDENAALAEQAVERQAEISRIAAELARKNKAIGILRETIRKLTALDIDIDLATEDDSPPQPGDTSKPS